MSKRRWMIRTIEADTAGAKLPWARGKSRATWKQKARERAVAD